MKTASWLRELVWVSPSLRLATTVLDEAQLSPGEKLILDGLGCPERRLEWLRARARLKEVLHDLGEPTETGGIGFPHPRFSVSHSGNVAAALGIAPAPGIAGVGVDFERHRPMDPRSARFFLRDEERAVFSLIMGPENLLRLWTVKEALFKAHPENKGQGVRDYIVTRPEVMGGSAIHRATGRRFLYQSERLTEGYLTVAVCLTKEIE